MVAMKLLHEVIGGLTKDMAVVSVTISGNRQSSLAVKT
ncbi:hypothetical protein DLJ82_5419 (plasmid) [Rhizobium leguminosarum]|uniref:Uncharacterized protein n=2 Tax=Rhizobium leguminosarum TaxID=384 RepID=A0A2Z4YNH4_RHILE|nr:hypothetical protein DLJ82_5419 [Rhizobium leguminosarum]